MGSMRTTRSTARLNPSEREALLLRLSQTNDRDPEGHIRPDKARAMVAFAIKKGALQRGPCEVCGAVDGVDGHHDDYDEPLNVRWLCKVHHRQHHAQLQTERGPRQLRGTISWRAFRDSGGPDEPVMVVLRRPDGFLETLGLWIPAWLVDE